MVQPYVFLAGAGALSHVDVHVISAIVYGILHVLHTPISALAGA